MSDFFARPPQPDEPPAERYVPPPWSEPPRGVLPGVVGVEMVLARNARAAVFVGGLTAYPRVSSSRCACSPRATAGWIPP